MLQTSFSGTQNWGLTTIILMLLFVLPVAQTFERYFLRQAPSTISRALQDHPRIGVETKTRVRALAKEMGYVPI